MEFSRRIYGYCERGFGPGPGADAFWAEPWNAITNGAFILAAILGLALAIGNRRLDGPVSWLIFLTFCVGVGSFLFHTYAVVWAAMSDTIPILIFILSYFAISMRCYGGFGWGRSLALMASFLVLLIATSTVLRYGLDSLPGAIDVLRYEGEEDYARRAGGLVVLMVLTVLAARFVLGSLVGMGFAGSVGVTILWVVAISLLSKAATATIPRIFPGMQSYLPALMALGGVGLWLALRGHPAGRWLLVVAAVFAVSLTARALDRPLCANFLMGTHWVWHVLNGVVLGSLIIALIRHGTGKGQTSPA
ncbi:MAG: ceramidase domain-containing protein [Pseudomonadota bacterium]